MKKVGLDTLNYMLEECLIRIPLFDDSEKLQRSYFEMNEERSGSDLGGMVAWDLGDYALFINTKQHKDFKHLYTTIAHELIHCLIHTERNDDYSHTDHGELFQRYASIVSKHMDNMEIM